MINPTTQIKVHINAGPQADQEEQSQVALRLRQDLLELDVESVEQFRTAAAPAGAKGGAAAVGTLVVTLAPLALKAVTDMLQSWLSRHEGASITLESGDTEIVVTGAPSKGQQAKIAEWVARQNA